VVGEDARGAGEHRDDESGDHAVFRVDPEKKSRRASERNEAKRTVWREQTRGIAPERFVWVDETGSNLGLTRTHSRAPRGQRAYGDVPHRRGPNRTLITALTLDGFGPGLLLDEAIDRTTFDGYIIHRLAPTLKPGQIVVVDNLKVHYSDRAKAAIEACGAHLWYLPAYSPDLNPIEEAFSKVKSFLRSAAPRTLDDHSTALWPPSAPSHPTMRPAGSPMQAITQPTATLPTLRHAAQRPSSRSPTPNPLVPSPFRSHQASASITFGEIRCIIETLRTGVSERQGSEAVAPVRLT